MENNEKKFYIKLAIIVTILLGFTLIGINKFFETKIEIEKVKTSEILKKSEIVNYSRFNKTFIISQDEILEKETDFPEKAYTIQVFSSKDKKESIEKSYAFKRYGKVFLFPKNLNGEIWYRVCVEIFKKRKDAVELTEEIQKTVPDSLIINLIN